MEVLGITPPIALLGTLGTYISRVAIVLTWDEALPRDCVKMTDRGAEPLSPVIAVSLAFFLK